MPVSAGPGAFLDSDSYEELEVDESVPASADYAVRISGDSMTPRFVDRQIVFVKEQPTLAIVHWWNVKRQKTMKINKEGSEKSAKDTPT